MYISKIHVIIRQEVISYILYYESTKVLNTWPVYNAHVHASLHVTGVIKTFVGELV